MHRLCTFDYDKIPKSIVLPQSITLILPLSLSLVIVTHLKNFVSKVNGKKQGSV
jgi:hypothetical protein